ncbi:tyrosine-protein phosphatase [Microbulbifer sp. ARAS458-1]|uniref:tyrosine-protein phosphatase n=1 Tax=Microbulbifer sp. ARAS458-1 TaxID=3140242 RepID=UPI003877D421
MNKRITNTLVAALAALALGGCASSDVMRGNALSQVKTLPAEQAAVPAAIEHTRVLPLEGGRNFRDLGGYKTADGKTVKWGKLYRSGVLTNLTEGDYEFLSNRDIATVVDFRSSEERSSEPTHWQAGEIDHMTWDYQMMADWEAEFGKVLRKPDFTRQDLVALMDKGYVGLVRQQTPHYKAMFQKLIESDDALLFHCSAGKDRTGIGAALILTALGVDRATIEQDYLLTNEVIKNSKHDIMQLPEDASEKQRQMYAFFAQLPPEVRNVLAGVEVSWLESAFAEMERQHGSVEGYIQHALDVDAQELALLKARYLQ